MDRESKNTENQKCNIPKIVVDKKTDNTFHSPTQIPEILINNQGTDKESKSYLESNHKINEKFFPNKANYFRFSESNNYSQQLNFPNRNSPILNYFSSFNNSSTNLYYSPNTQEINIKNIPNTKKYLSNTQIMKINPSNFISNLNYEQNFDYSPGKIFNVENSSTSLNNFINNNGINEDFYDKTLQEKMEYMIGKTDDNNFIKKNILLSNNNNNISSNKNIIQLKEEKEEDKDEQEGKQEIFMLSFDSIDEKDIDEENEKNNNKSPEININSDKSEERSKSNKYKRKKIIQKNTNHKNEEINNVNIKNNNVYTSENKNINKNIGYSIINNNLIYPPILFNNIGYNYQYPSNFLPINNNNIQNFQNLNNNFNNNAYNMNDLKHLYPMMENDTEKNNIQIFNYNGDSYQITKKTNENNNNNNNIHTINNEDLVTVITSNNKKVKRINPKTYLNESFEYLSLNIFFLAKDQAGCRFLQEKLEKEPEKATKYFYKAIQPYLIELIKDPFGNYLIQKICNNLKPEEIKKILEIIFPVILDIGTNTHGTRVIQHLIYNLSTNEMVLYFLNNIKPFVIPLLKELNGSYIIQKFTTEHPEIADEINIIIIENCSELAKHKYGCRVLQKYLDGPDKNLKKKIVNILINNCKNLIIDQYANYVIQCVIVLNDKKANNIIIDIICENIIFYAKNRFSCNVVEKCFDVCNEIEKKKLVEKICPQEIIGQLILDEHGNYVVQKALENADIDTKSKMLIIIIRLLPMIKSTFFGDRLIQKLKANYSELNNNNNFIITNNYLNNNGNLINNYNNNNFIPSYNNSLSMIDIMQQNQNLNYPFQNVNNNANNIIIGNKINDNNKQYL